MSGQAIHLVVMQPVGYLHSQGFLDQARHVRWQLRRLGATVTLAKNRLREDAVNLIFGAHLGFPVELQQRQPHLRHRSAQYSVQTGNTSKPGADVGGVSPVPGQMWAG